MKRLAIKMVMGFCFLALAAQAQAVVISPDSGTLDLTRWEGDQTSQAQINVALNALFDPDPVELYKQDVGGSESGLTGSYETTFTPPTDPSGATITYTGGTFIGPTAYLLVKDGNQEPAWYFFNLTAIFDWDGMETLELEEFWPSNGAISHVALYGTPGISVPEAGALLMFGSGLIGLVGYRRMRRMK